MFKQETSRDRNITYFRYVTSKRVVGSCVVNNLSISINHNKNRNLISVIVRINRFSKDIHYSNNIHTTDSDLLKTLEETFRKIEHSHINKCLTESYPMREPREIERHIDGILYAFNKVIKEKYQNNK